MEFLVISGLSGAGKSRTMDILEDLNYYCVDNMPAVLIPKFAELCLATRSRYERVALVTDIRERNITDDLFDALDKLWALGCEYKILFVEASVETIVKRYKETRRRHPLSEGGSIEEAVREEIKLLAPMRERADFVLDTSTFTLGMLQGEIYKLFMGDAGGKRLRVNLISFGFKYGIPLEADLVFDVRFLPNPFYIPELRPLTGMDDRVRDFVHMHKDTRDFMEHLYSMLEFLLPLYSEEGKYSLTVAIGCTGGRHRSVAVSRSLSDFLLEKGYQVQLINRDSDKG